MLILRSFEFCRWKRLFRSDRKEILEFIVLKKIERITQTIVKTVIQLYNWIFSFFIRVSPHLWLFWVCWEINWEMRTIHHKSLFSIVVLLMIEKIIMNIFFSCIHRKLCGWDGIICLTLFELVIMAFVCYYVLEWKNIIFKGSEGKKWIRNSLKKWFFRKIQISLKDNTVI